MNHYSIYLKTIGWMILGYVPIRSDRVIPSSVATADSAARRSVRFPARLVRTWASR